MLGPRRPIAPWILDITQSQVLLAQNFLGYPKFLLAPRGVAGA